MNNIEFTISASNKQYAKAKIDELDCTATQYLMTITKRKARRSTEQNSRYWKILTELGKHLGYTHDEMHEIMRYKFLRNMVEINGESVPLLSSTTKLNTAQFADYMDSIERFGHGLGYFFQE